MSIKSVDLILQPTLLLTLNDNASYTFDIKPNSSVTREKGYLLVNFGWLKLGDNNGKDGQTD